MGSVRAQQVRNSQVAYEQAETNKAAANAAGSSVPAIAAVAHDNGVAIQSLIAAVQRLEALVEKLMDR